MSRTRLTPKGLRDFVDGATHGAAPSPSFRDELGVQRVWNAANEAQQPVPAGRA